MEKYNTTEAGEMLGIKTHSVTKYINTGKIKAEKHGRDYFISLHEIALFQECRKKRGRPKT